MATKSKEEILEEELERLLRVGAVRRVPKLQFNGLSPSNEGTHPDKERETFMSDVIIGRSGKQYSRKKIYHLVHGNHPQVILKISTYRKTLHDIKNHLNYVTRSGKIPLEDQNGNPIQGKDEWGSMAELWHDTELMKAFARARYLGKTLDEHGYPRVAMSIVLSMPPGTNRQLFMTAIREYGQEQFSEQGYEYMLAFHNDTRHPHAHMLLRMRNIETNHKLNPGKADIKAWREALQEKMEEFGLFTTSVSSRLRGLMASENRVGIFMDVRDMRRAMTEQGMDETAITRFLQDRGKGQIGELANRQEMLTRRQKNLRASVLRALQDPGQKERMRTFAAARREERRALQEAIGNIAKDIARDNPQEAGMLVQYVNKLPDETPEGWRILQGIKAPHQREEQEK